MTKLLLRSTSSRYFFYVLWFVFHQYLAIIFTFFFFFFSLRSQIWKLLKSWSDQIQYFKPGFPTFRSKWLAYLMRVFIFPPYQFIKFIMIHFLKNTCIIQAWLPTVLLPTKFPTPRLSILANLKKKKMKAILENDFNFLLDC